MATLLALETSTESASVALLHRETLHLRKLDTVQAQSGQVLELVRAVLNDGGVLLNACDAIAFGAGPGAFTGLRVACAVTQGLAFGADKPVIAIGSLLAMAEQMRSSVQVPQGARVLSALDARMGEVYWSVLEWHGQQWHTLIAPSLDPPDALEKNLATAGVIQKLDYGCGNALRVFAESLSKLVLNTSSVERPDAGGVADLAAKAWAQGHTLAPADAAPLYVRNRVALTTAERAGSSLSITPA